MSTRSGRHDRAVHPLSVLVALSVMLVTLTGLGLEPAAAASRACLVRDPADGRTFASLQRAVDASRPGQTLLTQGTCRGQVVIDKDLRIMGMETAGRRAVLRWAPEGTRAAGTAVKVGPDARVVFSDLTINGHEDGRGFGVENQGMLTFHAVAVRDFTRVGIRNRGTLRLLGRSVVTGMWGDGIHTSGRLILDDASRVEANGDDFGSHNIRNSGVVIMRQSSLVGPAGFDIGSAVENLGRFVMRGASRITGHDNSGPAFVNRASGTLIMRGQSSIHHNTSGESPHLCAPGRSDGGGVRNRGTLVMRDHSSIHHNSARFEDYCGEVTEHVEPSTGGGVYNHGTLRMTGSSRIYGNSVTGQGGGIYNSAAGILRGVFCGPVTLANVYANTPDDCYFADHLADAHSPAPKSASARGQVADGSHAP
jgi:hypothetical protein